MSYKGSGKDYRHIVSVTDIVNNNIPINIKNLDRHMRLILNSKCVCTVDIDGGVINWLIMYYEIIKPY